MNRRDGFMGMPRQVPHTGDTHEGNRAAVARRRAPLHVLSDSDSFCWSSGAFSPSSERHLLAVSSLASPLLTFFLCVPLHFTLSTGLLYSTLRSWLAPRPALLPLSFRSGHVLSRARLFSVRYTPRGLGLSSSPFYIRVLSPCLSSRSSVGARSSIVPVSPTCRSRCIAVVSSAARNATRPPPVPSSLSGSSHLSLPPPRRWFSGRGVRCPLALPSYLSSFSLPCSGTPLVRHSSLPLHLSLSASPVTVFSASPSVTCLSFRSLSSASSSAFAASPSSQAPPRTSSIALPSVRLLLRLTRFVDRHPSLLVLLTSRLRFSSEGHPSLDALLSLVVGPSPSSLYVPLPRVTLGLQPQVPLSSFTSVSSGAPSSLAFHEASAISSRSPACPPYLVTPPPPRGLSAPSAQALASGCPAVAPHSTSEERLTFAEELCEDRQNIRRTLPPAGPLSSLFRQYMRSSSVGKEGRNGGKFTVAHAETSLDFIWASIRLLGRLRRYAFDYCRRLQAPLPLLLPHPSLEELRCTLLCSTPSSLARDSRCTSRLPPLSSARSRGLGISAVTPPSIVPPSSARDLSSSSLFLHKQNGEQHHQVYLLLRAALWYAAQGQPHYSDELAGLFSGFAGNQRRNTPGETERPPLLLADEDGEATTPVPSSCLEESVNALLLPQYKWKDEDQGRRYASALHVLYLSKYARPGCSSASLGRERTDRKSRGEIAGETEDGKRRVADGTGQKEESLTDNGYRSESSAPLDQATATVSRAPDCGSGSLRPSSSVGSPVCSSLISSGPCAHSASSSPLGPPRCFSPVASSSAAPPGSFSPGLGRSPASRLSSSSSKPVYVSSIKRGQLLLVHPLTSEATWSRAVVLITHVSRKGYVEGVVLNKRRAWIPGAGPGSVVFQKCNEKPCSPCALKDEREPHSRTQEPGHQSPASCAVDLAAALAGVPGTRSEEADQTKKQEDPCVLASGGGGCGKENARVRASVGRLNFPASPGLVEGRSLVSPSDPPSSGCGVLAAADSALCSGVVCSSYSNFVAHLSAQLSILQTAKKHLQSPEALALYFARSLRKETAEIPGAPRGDTGNASLTGSASVSTGERASLAEAQRLLPNCSSPSAGTNLSCAVGAQPGPRPQESGDATLDSPLPADRENENCPASSEGVFCLGSPDGAFFLSPGLVTAAEQLVSRAIAALLLHQREAVIDRAEAADMLHVIMEELCTDAAELVNLQTPSAVSSGGPATSVQAAELLAEAPYLLELLQWFADRDSEESGSGSTKLSRSTGEDDGSVWGRDEGIFFSGVYFPPRRGGGVSRTQRGDRGFGRDSGSMVESEAETDRADSICPSSTQVASTTLATPREHLEAREEVAAPPVPVVDSEPTGHQKTREKADNGEKATKKDYREKKTVQEVNLDPLLTFLAHLPMGKVSSAAAMHASRKSRRDVVLSRLQSLVSRKGAYIQSDCGDVVPQECEARKRRKPRDNGESHVGVGLKQKASESTVARGDTAAGGVAVSDVPQGSERDAAARASEPCLPRSQNVPAADVLDRQYAAGVSVRLPQERLPTQMTEPTGNGEFRVMRTLTDTDTAVSAGGEVGSAIMARTGEKPFAGELLGIGEATSEAQSAGVRPTRIPANAEREEDNSAESDARVQVESVEEERSSTRGIWSRYSFGGPVPGYTVLHTNAQAGVVEVHKGLYLGTRRKGDRKTRVSSSASRTERRQRTREASPCEGPHLLNSSGLFSSRTEEPDETTDGSTPCSTAGDYSRCFEPRMPDKGGEQTDPGSNSSPVARETTAAAFQNRGHGFVGGPGCVRGKPESSISQGSALPEEGRRVEKGEQQPGRLLPLSGEAERKRKSESNISAAVQDTSGRQESDVSYRWRRFLGKAAWRPGQLEREIARGMWVLVGCTDAGVMEELVFDDVLMADGVPSTPNCWRSRSFQSARSFYQSEAAVSDDEDDLWRRILAALSANKTAGVDCHMYEAMARLPVCLVKHVEDQYGEEEDMEEDSDEEEAEY